MNHFRCSRSFLTFTVGLGLLMVLLSGNAWSGQPYSAYYSADSDRIFWFIQVSDTHIGARGVQDSDNLLWLVTVGKDTVNPEFIVVSGDLTDSTNGNIFGLPNGPYQQEWDQYKSILSQGDNINATNYYDLPGNHDAYSDRNFDFYRANSVQGQATGATQVSWTRQFGYGRYHFLGINTADNTGDPFSLSWPWGDYAGLDTSELSFIQSDLDSNDDADLTFVFGHHPVTDTGASDDTWLYYGESEFISLLDQSGASLYGYGHTHRYSEELFSGDAYTGHVAGDGVVYLNISSLGKSSENNFSVIAVDCNGISTKTQNMGVWPLVMVTAPVDGYLGVSPNPYSYAVPNAADNPIRALVFDAGAISQVRYRIDADSQWYPMRPVPGNQHLWEAVWDASLASEGEHTIEVQATGSTVRSDVITVSVYSGNHVPAALGQSVDTNEDVGTPIELTATDPDGDALVFEVLSQPAHGSLGGSAPSLTYSPGADYNGGDGFTFRAYDGSAYSNEATVTITVAPVNDAPVAVDDAYGVDQDQMLSVPASGVLSNDTDVDGDALTASVVGTTTHGSLNFGGNGAFIYTPDSGFFGEDNFTYVARDGSDDSLQATVSIAVHEVTTGDTTAPTPNPMAWAQPPQALDSNSITMTAAAAADASGVAYYFQCTSGGCHDSGPQSTAVYTDTGLNPDTPYSYVVFAEDLSTNHNRTAASEEATATTEPTANQSPGFYSDPITEADAMVGVPYDATLQDDADDPDAGDTLAFSKIDGPSWLNVAAGGHLTGMPGETDAGVNEFTVLVEDGHGGVDTATLNITVNPPGEDEFYADSETGIRGTVAGSYQDTQSDDNVYEELTEELRARRFSVLEHTWTFNVTGNASMAFLVQAYHSPNNEGDDFVFAYSLDNTTFTEMVVVSNTLDLDSYQRFDLPAYLSGTVYVRVTDTDSSKNNNSMDTLYVDDMRIITSAVAGMPGTASDPSPANEATNVDTNTTLSWSPGANAQWHNVYFGDNVNDLQLASSAQTETSYNPGSLQQGATYYWKIDEENDVGITPGALWSFTTSSVACDSSTSIESISLSTVKGPAGTSYGQAVVVIVDACGSPAEDVFVTGQFTGDFTGNYTQTTDADGAAVFVTDTNIKKPSFDFVVTDLQ